MAMFYSAASKKGAMPMTRFCHHATERVMSSIAPAIAVVPSPNHYPEQDSQLEFSHVSPRTPKIEPVPVSANLDAILPPKPLELPEPAVVETEKKKIPIHFDAFGNMLVGVYVEVDVDPVKAVIDGVPDRVSEVETRNTALDEAAFNRILNHLQVASPESALGFVHVTELLTEREQEALHCRLQARVKNGKEMPECLLSD